ncbi:hypothetical protein GCM10025857_16280 [Alicyclobacillus contaminans]|uniref:hypothetical protein n=1 Tax=Alicyclobacillus contaminans TaxID=392016 RepID=UPI000421C2BC|nr:hypothetical protein [Alicyclobacillus contaminans]GMA50271.1 hypothetical protein GCM10025857_16280 [Alicyclobacillus contaminans]
MVIQPLLNGMIRSLPTNRVADGNTLFNLVQRLGETLGISLVVTFFQERMRLRVAEAMHLPSSSGLPSLPPCQATTTNLATAARSHWSSAATAGCHDAIWLMLGVSLVGCFIALWLRNPTAASARSKTGSSYGGD